MGRKYVQIFVCGNYLFREANSFPRARPEKTVSSEEEMMSKGKYPSVLSCQIEAIVFIILQIFLATRAVLEIVEYHSDIPQF